MAQSQKLDPPLFAVEANDVAAFIDTESATNYLEPPDVEAGAFRFFDRSGVEYGLSTKVGKVVVGARIGEAPEYLARQLRMYLKHVPRKRRPHDDSEIDAMDLVHLVDEFRRVERM